MEISVPTNNKIRFTFILNKQVLVIDKINEYFVNITYNFIVNKRL